MCGDRKNWNAHLSKIHEVFEGNFVTLQVAPHGNVIVLAFKDVTPNTTGKTRSDRLEPEATI